MNRHQFLEEFAEILGVSVAALLPGTQLSTLETWDSVSYLATMVLFDEKVGRTVSPEDLTAVKTVQDLLDLAGPALQA